MPSKERRKREKQLDYNASRKSGFSDMSAIVGTSTNDALPSATAAFQPPATPTTPAPVPKKTRNSENPVGTFVFPSTSSTPLRSIETLQHTPVTELETLSLFGNSDSTPRGRLILSHGLTTTENNTQRTRSLSIHGMSQESHINRTPSGGSNINNKATRRSSRLAERNEHSFRELPPKMERVKTDYLNRPWPKLSETKKKHRRSSSATLQNCGDNCDCTSYAQCYQNAVAFLAAYNYIQKYDPVQHNTLTPPNFRETSKCVKGGRPTAKCHFKNKLKCASKSAAHRIDYYDSGQFGGQSGNDFCPHCKAVLLRGETEMIKRGRQTPCCANGASNTQQMHDEFDELQKPPTKPVDYRSDLIESTDDKLREAFLNNTMPLNNTFGFASISSEKAPDDQLGGRKDACKYNGEFSFQFSDLIAPEGRRPTFAQVYTLDPATAFDLRNENLASSIPSSLKKMILYKLQQLMRENPFGQTFESVGNHIRNAEQRNEEIPHFQIVLLSNRELKEEAIKNRGDCLIIEKTDAPTAKQVAVVWVQEDGLAPEIHGFWISDQAGKMHELKNSSPQLDPCCFPLLHPRGTLGYRWFLKKKGFMLTREETEQLIMQHSLDEAMELELYEEIEKDMSNQVGTSLEMATEMPEPENKLDGEELTEDITGTMGEPDHLIDLIDCGDSIEQRDNIENSTPDGATKKTNISERQFYRYRMAIRGTKDAFHWLWFARKLAEYFTITVLNRIERNEMDHLRLIQIKKNYRKILAREYVEALEKGLQKWGQAAKLGKIFLMPQTFAGSKQYYQGKYADLMTIVRYLGNPTWFVTFTGNPKWPEIQEALRGQQDYVHRPDVVCRIFMDKVTEFIKDVTQRHVLGKVAGWCYSVEHQKRGMPHIHLLLILEKGGRVTSPEHVDEYISARIPTLPRIEDLSVEANQQRRLWYYVTHMMMHDCNAACLEGSLCKKHFPKPYSDRTELSEVRYTNYVRLPPEDVDLTLLPRSMDQQTPLDEEDHLPMNDPERDMAEVRYQRIPQSARQPVRLYEETGNTYNKKKRGVSVGLLMDDRRVIPYNPYLLLKYGCHINVEYVFGQKACKYIFKYLLKGFEKGYVKVAQPKKGQKNRSGDYTNDTYDYDEISATFKVRYMTALEAYLRLHSYKIVQMSHQIYTLSVHDEGGQTIVVEEGHEEEGKWKIDANTRLTAFFKLCGVDHEARKLTYDRVPYYYTWDKNSREWKRRKNPISEDPGKARMFVRVYTVSPRKHELYAIRLLLLSRPGPTSFKDLRTVGTTIHPSFTKAAEDLGLLESDDLFRRAMDDACVEKMNFKQLQHYFAMLILHANPSNPQALFDDFLDKMNPPIALNDPTATPKTTDMRGAEVMRNVEYFLNCMGSSCGDMGLKGLPVDYDFLRQEKILEEEGVWDMFYGQEQKNKLTPQQIALKGISQLNKDQRSAFDRISEAVLRGGGSLFFLEGAGGTGKTFLYNTLIRWCLAGKPQIVTHEDLCTPLNPNPSLERGSVIASASTGIAALLLIGGATAHRQFFIPNDVDDKTPPSINVESTKAEQLRGANLIIIDEISMLSSKVFRYIDRLLRDVCDNDKPFGGKTLILGGDWRQLAPVVEHGTREDQVNDSIRMDPLFRETSVKLSLSINMRTAPSEAKLREWLTVIGNGLHQVENEDSCQRLLQIPEEIVAESLEDVINFCFPPGLFDDPLQNAGAIAENAILCPTNVAVQDINKMALDRLCGEAKSFPSLDQPLEPRDDLSDYRTDFNLETIHQETPSGMPPHDLNLKVGTPLMLIRNLDVSQGLCNGTRMQVVKMTEENLYCRILTGPRADVKHTYIIPRVKFEYGRGQHHRGLRFSRLQFPVRPCFAMTVNKAQGQTLKRMALVLDRGQCFAHGQVYVAMSRVTRMDGIRVYAPFSKSGDATFIENVVCHELLDGVKISPRPQIPKKPPIPVGIDELADDSDENGDAYPV